MPKVKVLWSASSRLNMGCMGILFWYWAVQYPIYLRATTGFGCLVFGGFVVRVWVSGDPHMLGWVGKTQVIAVSYGYHRPIIHSPSSVYASFP